VAKVRRIVRHDLINITPRKICFAFIEISRYYAALLSRVIEYGNVRKQTAAGHLLRYSTNANI
jgi:hypothetical protein